MIPVDLTALLPKVALNISKAGIDQLVQHAVSIISSELQYKFNIQHENFFCIDIGIGSLWIQILKEDIAWKFIPSETLENTIKDSIKNKSDILVSELEQKLNTTLLSYCNERIDE